ncbi:hypothetical protein V490_00893, partial [Pseudogymnoascus sp. VKM F-3557]
KLGHNKYYPSPNLTISCDATHTAAQAIPLSIIESSDDSFEEERSSGDVVKGLEFLNPLTLKKKLVLSVTMPELQRWEIQEPYLRPNGDLLEGPFYEPENNRLRFVDIIQRKLHVIDLAEGPSSLKTIDFDIPVGVTADIEGVDNKDKILIGGKTGIAILDRNTGKYEYIKRFYDDADETRDDRIRSNDGNVDSEGRMWIATMTDFHAGPCKPEGHLLSFDSSLTRETHRSELVIPNSVGWSLSNTTFYLVHSTEATIYAYDFDAATGAISNPRVFWKLGTGAEPDGFAIDVEGFIWQAVYGDGKVLRISPEGKTVGEIILPTRNVTCCAFVGEDLWITTASESAENAKKYPESARNGGALYKINVGIQGLEKHKFRLAEDVRKTVGLSSVFNVLGQLIPQISRQELEA